MRLILGGVFDQFTRLQIIVGHQFETLSWWAWRADYVLSLSHSGLKRTIKEYLRENFYGGILAREWVDQSAGEMDSGWSMANNVYQAMVNVIGIDRIVFTAVDAIFTGKERRYHLIYVAARKHKRSGLQTRKFLAHIG